MTTIKDNDLVLARRMQEFCRPPTAWNRCLWGVSLQTTLRDVLEACEVRRHGILSVQAVVDLQNSAAIAVGTDVGAGIEKTRRQMQQLLSGRAVVTPGSLAAETTAICIEDVKNEYLKRWAIAVRGGVSDELIERLCTFRGFTPCRPLPLSNENLIAHPESSIQRNRDRMRCGDVVNRTGQS